MKKSKIITISILGLLLLIPFMTPACRLLPVNQTQLPGGVTKFGALSLCGYCLKPVPSPAIYPKRWVPPWALRWASDLFLGCLCLMMPLCCVTSVMPAAITPRLKEPSMRQHGPPIRAWMCPFYSSVKTMASVFRCALLRAGLKETTSTVPACSTFQPMV